MSYIMIVFMTLTLSTGEKYEKVEMHDFKYKNMEECIKHKTDVISLTKDVKINKVYCVEAQ